MTTRLVALEPPPTPIVGAARFLEHNHHARCKSFVSAVENEPRFLIYFYPMFVSVTYSLLL